jgi:hypothetical protein
MCKYRDCLGYTGQVEANIIARSVANERIAAFLISQEKFLDEIEERLDETCTDEFMDHGEPYMVLDDIAGLVKSFKSYLKKFREEGKK